MLSGEINNQITQPYWLDVYSKDVEVRDVYKLASERNLQLRRLSQRRDTLEDIFLKAMEANNNGGV